MKGMKGQPGIARNLDVRCAELGKKLAEMPDMQTKTLHAALSVLEEQGPFALFLYLKSREAKLADSFIDEWVPFVCHHVFQKPIEECDAKTLAKNDGDKWLTVMQQLSSDLDDLLFAKDLLRQALIYATYFLKAEGEKG